MTSQPSYEYEELRIGFTAAALKQMKFEPVKYVVPGYIAEGLTLFAGKPKLGKSGDGIGYRYRRCWPSLHAW